MNFAAGVAENFPSSQSLHAPTPAETLYFPATHAEHDPPAGPEKPALQVQLVLVEPPDDMESSGQSMHGDIPVKSLYVPAMHAAQVPPRGPEYPALHLQAANSVLCPGEVAFPGHGRHVESDVAPTVAEYLPAKQLLHAPAPREFLYVPAPHAVHVCPLEPG